MNNIKEVWYYIYGKGSHLNISGKIILGVPFFPLIFSGVILWNIMSFLFASK
jgi:hypothetical protein